MYILIGILLMKAPLKVRKRRFTLESGWYFDDYDQNDPWSDSSYFPKEIRREGFVCKVEGLASALTLTLMKPEIKLPDIVPG